MSKEAEKCKAKFLVVLIPAGFQIHEVIFDGLIKGYGFNTDDYSMDYLDSMLQERLIKEGISVLNLLPVLKGRKEDKLYAVGHWTPKAHGIAADEIHKFIENEKIILK